MTEEMALEKTGGKELKNIIFDKGVIPKDYEDVLRFAGLIHGAGLAPKGFDTPAKCAIGILTNLEQGRPAITGLQDLAIINGKCGTYGNAITAKITSSGLMDKDYPVETETGTPYEDDWSFTYTVKRKGRPAVTGRWTWVDSKRAGFNKPKTKDGRDDIWSPWTRFTRRMMQWKARSFVNQDEFGDILRGMTPVEDLYDIVDLEPGKNGTYASPEATKEPKEKPNYAAQDLKAKLDAGDTQVEGYNALNEEEPAPSPLEQGEPQSILPDGVDPIAWLLTSRGKSSPKNAALVIEVFQAEKKKVESESDAVKARLLRKYKDAMDYLADIEAKKQAIAEEEAPDAVKARLLRKYKDAMDDIEAKKQAIAEEEAPDAVKARLLRKYKDAMDDIEAKKQAIAEEEAPIETPPPGSGIPPFEQEPKYNANGRLAYISKMRKYKEKDSDKYAKVLQDNDLDDMNAAKVGDEEAILHFMAEEFGE